MVRMLHIPRIDMQGYAASRPLKLENVYTLIGV